MGRHSKDSDAVKSTHVPAVQQFGGPTTFYGCLSQVSIPVVCIDSPALVNGDSLRCCRYLLQQNFARGGFGEVWLATRLEGEEGGATQSSCRGAREDPGGLNSSDKEGVRFVLKRLLVSAPATRPSRHSQQGCFSRQDHIACVNIGMWLPGHVVSRGGSLEPVRRLPCSEDSQHWLSNRGDDTGDMYQS